jgi:hypothetical protein
MFWPVGGAVDHGTVSVTARNARLASSLPVTNIEPVRMLS